MMQAEANQFGEFAGAGFVAREADGEAGPAFRGERGDAGERDRRGGLRRSRSGICAGVGRGARTEAEGISRRDRGVGVGRIRRVHRRRNGGHARRRENLHFHRGLIRSEDRLGQRTGVRLSRRRLLQAGGAGLLGLSLPKVLAAEAAATLRA